MQESAPTTLDSLKTFLQSHVPFTKELNLLAELRSAEHKINLKLRSRASLSQLQANETDLLNKREKLETEASESEKVKENVYLVKRIKRLPDSQAEHPEGIKFFEYR